MAIAKEKTNSYKIADTVQIRLQQENCDVMDEKFESPTGSRIVFLDTLRFIAAAAVVFQHVIEVSGRDGENIVAALSPGVFGVVLFFIISGFVIPMTVKNRLEIRKFAIRRFFRIYPLVTTTFALVALLGYSRILPKLDFVLAASAHDWLANVLLIQDYVGSLPIWGVTWTLSLEFLWYSIFAIAYLCIGSKYHELLAVIAPCLLTILICISFMSGYRLPVGRIGLIYAAVLGARMYSYYSGVLGLRQVLTDLGLFMIIMAAGNIVAFGYFSHPNITMNQSLYPWLVAPIVFGSVSLIPVVRISLPFNNRIAGWLGSISFSTYMLHGFAISTAIAYAPARDLISVSIILTFIFSAIGYYLIEVPGQNLGHRLGRVTRAVPTISRATPP